MSVELVFTDGDQSYYWILGCWSLLPEAISRFFVYVYISETFAPVMRMSIHYSQKFSSFFVISPFSQPLSTFYDYSLHFLECIKSDKKHMYSFLIWQTWVWVLTMPFTCCVILDTLFNFSTTITFPMKTIISSQGYYKD